MEDVNKRIVDGIYGAIVQAQNLEEVEKIIKEQQKSHQRLFPQVIERLQTDINSLEDEKEESTPVNKQAIDEIISEITAEIEILKRYTNIVEEETEESLDEELAEGDIDIKSPRPLRIIWAKQGRGVTHCYYEFKRRKNEIARENYKFFWILLKKFIDDKNYQLTEKMEMIPGLYKIKPNGKGRQERLYAYQINGVIFIIGAYNKKGTSPSVWERWLRKRANDVQEELEELKKKLANATEEEIKEFLDSEENKKDFKDIEELIKPKSSTKDEEKQDVPKESEEDSIELSKQKQEPQEQIEINENIDSTQKVSEEDIFKQLDERDAITIRLLRIFYEENHNLEIPENNQMYDTESGKKFSVGRRIKSLKTMLNDRNPKIELLIKLILDITPNISWIPEEAIKRVSMKSYEEILETLKEKQKKLKEETIEVESTPQTEKEEIEVLDLNTTDITPSEPKLENTDNIFHLSVDLYQEGGNITRMLDVLTIYYASTGNLDIPEDLVVVEPGGREKELGKWFNKIINATTMSKQMIHELSKATDGKILDMLQVTKIDDSKQNEESEQIEELNLEDEETLTTGTIIILRKEIMETIKQSIEPNRFRAILEFIQSIVPSNRHAKVSPTLQKIWDESTSETVREWVDFEKISQQLTYLNEEELHKVLDYIIGEIQAIPKRI